MHVLVTKPTHERSDKHLLGAQQGQCLNALRYRELFDSRSSAAKHTLSSAHRACFTRVWSNLVQKDKSRQARHSTRVSQLRQSHHVLSHLSASASWLSTARLRSRQLWRLAVSWRIIPSPDLSGKHKTASAYGDQVGYVQRARISASWCHIQQSVQTSQRKHFVWQFQACTRLHKDWQGEPQNCCCHVSAQG